MALIRHIYTHLLKLFFYLLYHRFAILYDFVAHVVSVGRWKDWVLTPLPYLDLSSDCRVLELGHGPGHLLSELVDRGYLIVGLDESLQMGCLALRRIGIRENVLLVNGYAQLIPIQTHSINYIVSTFPSNYIYDPKTLSEIFRILYPGGKLLVLPVAWITGTRCHDRLAAWLFQITGQVPIWNSETTDVFRQAGFRCLVKRINSQSSTILLVIAEKPK